MTGLHSPNGRVYDSPQSSARAASASLNFGTMPPPFGPNNPNHVQAQGNFGTMGPGPQAASQPQPHGQGQTPRVSVSSQSSGGYWEENARWEERSAGASIVPLESLSGNPLPPFEKQDAGHAGQTMETTAW